ncbi:hypothetical protein P9453_22460, partial [Enterobacter bugandensis]
CHLMNLLVGRQFLQAISTLAGCSFRPTVFQRILAALQIPAFSGRMHGNIFVLTQYTFPDELLAEQVRFGVLGVSEETMWDRETRQRLPHYVWITP